MNNFRINLIHIVNVKTSCCVHYHMSTESRNQETKVDVINLIS